ncbi:MAG: hypothetical protein ACUVUE_03020 [Candidatus Bathycorpusculaceae bacterium]
MAAANHLKRMDYDAVFLNFSRNLEEGVKALAEGAPYDYVIERLIGLKLIPEPVGSWEYSAEPILKAIRGILNKKPDVKIHCYRDPSFDSFSAKTAEKIAILTFRAASTGKINVEKWEALLKPFLETEAEALEEETDFIARKAESSEDCVCIAGFDGRYIKTRLIEKGHDVTLTYIHVPYHFTPLEILMREMRRATALGAALSHKRITQLLKNHVQFIREYVTMNNDYDEAYHRWLHEKAQWLMSIQEHSGCGNRRR